MKELQFSEVTNSGGIPLSVSDIVKANRGNHTIRIRNIWTLVWAVDGGHLILIFYCPDGRHSISATLNPVRPNIVNEGAYTFIAVGTLGATVVDKPYFKQYLKWVADKYGVKTIFIAPHTVIKKGCRGCGAQAAKEDLYNDKAGTLKKAREAGLEYTYDWIDKNVHFHTPAEQGSASARAAYNMLDGKVDVTAWVFDHASQTHHAVEFWQADFGLRQTVLSSESNVWMGESELTTYALPDRAARFLDTNRQNGAALSLMAEMQGLPDAQHFKHIAYIDGACPMPTDLILGLETMKGLDVVFDPRILARPEAGIDEFKEGAGAAIAAADYSLAHANGHTLVYGFFTSEERAQWFMQRYCESGTARGHLSSISKNLVAFFIIDETGLITHYCVVKPAFTAV